MRTIIVRRPAESESNTNKAKMRKLNIRPLSSAYYIDYNNKDCYLYTILAKKEGNEKLILIPPRTSLSFVTPSTDTKNINLTNLFKDFENPKIIEYSLHCHQQELMRNPHAKFFTKENVLVKPDFLFELVEQDSKRVIYDFLCQHLKIRLSPDICQKIFRECNNLRFLEVMFLNYHRISDKDMIASLKGCCASITDVRKRLMIVVRSSDMREFPTILSHHIAPQFCVELKELIYLNLICE